MGESYVRLCNICFRSKNFYFFSLVNSNIIFVNRIIRGIRVGTIISPILSRRGRHIVVNRHFRLLLLEKNRCGVSFLFSPWQMRHHKRESLNHTSICPLGLVEEGYHSNNPYYNAIHAADVPQASKHSFFQEEVGILL